MSRQYDNNYKRYVGWESTEQREPDYAFLWEESRLKQIQQKITQLLMGVEPNNRPIVVTLEVIGNVLSSVVDSYQPQVGSILSRYIQNDPEGTRDDVREIVDRTINIIVTTVRNEMETIQQNKRLTVWNTVYGENNPEGLRAHSAIKLKERRPASFLFHMRY